MAVRRRPGEKAADEATSTGLTERLSARLSGAGVNNVLQWIGTDASRLRELISLVQSGDELLTFQAAWVLGHYGEMHPGMLTPWLGTLLELIAGEEISDAVRRGIFRAFQFVTFPPALLGKAVVLAFEHLSSPERPVAVRAYAMTVVERAVHQKPGLANEVRALLKHFPAESPPGILARARIVLQQIENKRGKE